MKMKTLDQERAAFAWQQVQGCSKEYANLAKGAPALIMGNGLMQTLAFFESKDAAAQKIGQHIRDWISRQYSTGFPKSDFTNFMGSLANQDSDMYLQVTEESLEFLRWVRQFASALQ